MKPDAVQQSDVPTMTAEFDLLTELMRLKAVPRMGWLLRGIRDVESVAE